jgi:hypothetical protein
MPKIEPYAASRAKRLRSEGVLYIASREVERIYAPDAGSGTGLSDVVREQPHAIPSSLSRRAAPVPNWEPGVCAD